MEAFNDNVNNSQCENLTGMLNVMSVNEIMKSLKNEPDPLPLFESLWFEGELACLFADSNVGKSIMAVQIGECISEQQPVLYVDCELTDKQFQKRYSSPDNSSCHVFPEEFYRATVAPERIGSGHFEDNLLKDIETAAFTYHCRVVILDNLTYACNTSEKGDAAGVFMMNLKKLQQKHGWSILVIAHTPKRDEKSAITANHLAGSKKLFNFFDSVFALGKSNEDKGFRYLKQLKVRSGEFIYTEDNVAVFELEKNEDGNLRFIFRKNDTEKEQLEPFFDYSDEERYDEVIELRESGLSYREIANKLGISKSSAHRIHQKYLERRRIVGLKSDVRSLKDGNDENDDVDEEEDATDSLMDVFIQESSCPSVLDSIDQRQWDADNA